jgi:hypothetical protein
MLLRGMLLLVWVAGGISTGRAGVDMAAPAPRAPDEHFYENRLDLSLENAQMLDINNKNNYWTSPVLLTLQWQLDDVGNEGWRRGNTSWLVSFEWNQVINGVEDRFAGLVFGPRYHFVQPGWKWVPYVDSRVGVAFCDSQDVYGAQGQDFCFTFMVGAGVRYLVSDRFDFSIGALYQHYSNADLSEPGRENFGLDLFGPHLSLNYRF